MGAERIETACTPARYRMLLERSGIDLRLLAACGKSLGVPESEWREWRRIAVRLDGVLERMKEDEKR